MPTAHLKAAAAMVQGRAAGRGYDQDMAKIALEHAGHVLTRGGAARPVRGAAWAVATSDERAHIGAPVDAARCGAGQPRVVELPT